MRMITILLVSVDLLGFVIFCSDFDLQQRGPIGLVLVFSLVPDIFIFLSTWLAGKA